MNRKNFLFSIIAIILAVSVTFIICEVFFRVFDISVIPDKILINDFYQNDVDLRWRLKSNFEKIDVIRYATNAQGFRADAPFYQKKKENVMRIVSLGDSFTFGAGCSIEDTYSAILKEKLNSLYDEADLTFEVYNGGVPGYGTVQEYLIFDKYLKQFNPDFVILQVYLENDLVDNYRFILEKHQVMGGYLVKRYTEETNCLQDIDFMLFRLSQFYKFVRVRIALLLEKVSASQYSHDKQKTNEEMQRMSDLIHPWDAYYIDRKELEKYDKIRKASQLFTEHVVKIRELCEQGNANFLVMAIPSIVINYSSMFKYNLNNWMIEELQPLELNIINLVEEFDKITGFSENFAQRLYVSGDYLLSALGNELVGEIVAKNLMKHDDLLLNKKQSFKYMQDIFLPLQNSENLLKQWELDYVESGVESVVSLLVSEAPSSSGPFRKKDASSFNELVNRFIHNKITNSSGETIIDFMISTKKNHNIVGRQFILGAWVKFLSKKTDDRSKIVIYIDNEIYSQTIFLFPENSYYFVALPLLLDEEPKEIRIKFFIGEFDEYIVDGLALIESNYLLASNKR